MDCRRRKRRRRGWAECRRSSRPIDSSTATHVLQRDRGERGFNVEYLALCGHLGLEACTSNPSCPHENGDIESANGQLKRRLETHLSLRGSREFGDEAALAGFVAEVCTGINALRAVKLAGERATSAAAAGDALSGGRTKRGCASSVTARCGSSSAPTRC